MARALTRSGLRVAAIAAVLWVLGDVGGSVLLAQGRRAQNALTTGIECYRRGNYELAEQFYQQAQVGQDDLTPAERQELQNRIKENAAALKARQDGAEQVRRAEEAVKAGRVQEAMDLLRAVTNNSYLVEADRQKAQQLSEQLHPRQPGPGQPAPAAAARTTPLVQARAKLEQARKLMAKGEYAAAEQLVNEADALGAVYTAGEDTPSKVRADLAKARTTDKHLATAARPKPDAGKVEPKDYKDLMAAGRTALEKGELDKAERLALEAERVDESWSHMFGDSPAKLLKDVQAAKSKKIAEKPTQTVLANPGGAGAARPNPATGAGTPTAARPEPKDGKKVEPKDYKDLMAAGRTALEKGELDKAERCAHDAEAADSSWSMHMFGDSPSKLLKDVQAARAKVAMNSKPKEKTPTSPTGPNGAPKTGTEGASMVLGAGAAPKETRPDAGKPAPVAGVTTPKPPTAALAPPPPAADTDGARALLQQARKALKDGDLARAKDLAEQANRKHPVLEFYEDNPARVLADVAAAEAKKTNGGIVVQAEPAKDPAKDVKPAAEPSGDGRAMLRQARALYTDGKLEEAKALAHKANGTSVKWGLFEDSPDKLMQDIQKAHAKRDQEESVKVLAEARKLYEQGKYDEAEVLAHKASRLHGDYTFYELGDRPQKLLGDIQTARAKNQKPALPEMPGAVVKTEPKSGPAGGPTPSWPAEKPAGAAQAPAAVAQAAPPPPDPKKEQVQKMMAEVRQLQKDGRLVEARQKALDAQKVGVVAYAPSEDRPETALLQLAALADKRIESLMQDATDCAAGGQAEPARFEKAQASLAQAKELAQGFGLDTQGIDNKMDWVRQVQTKAVAAAPNPLALPATVTPPAGIAPAAPAVSPAKQRGMELLAKSRQELRSGQMLTARRLAEEAFSGPYEVQSEASAMLRSIDAEEFNQHVRDAEHAYESGMTAYRHKDYAQARAIFANSDTRLLPPEKKKHLSEVMLSPEMQASNLPKPTPEGSVPPLKPAGGVPGSGVVQATGAAPAGADNYAKQVQVMQDVEFDRLRQEGLAVQRQATESFQKGDVDRALEMLTDYRNRMADSGLDQDRVVLLTKPVEARLQQFKTLKAQKTFEKLSQDQVATFRNRKEHEAEAERQKQAQVADLMKQYNAFRKEGKYDEALLAAAKAHELDPDNPMADAAQYIAKTLQRQKMANEGKESRRELFESGLDGAENFGPDVHDKHEVHFPKDFTDKTKGRDKWGNILVGKKSDKEREIEHRLSAPVNLEFKDVPLKTVISDLSADTGMNIVLDEAALEAKSISADQPLSLSVQGIALKSALNILLQRAKLTYVIKDEVLQVTTEENARGKLVQKTYPVADLIIPVDNHMIAGAADLMRVIGQGTPDSGAPGSRVPGKPKNGLPDAPTVSTGGSMMDAPPSVNVSQTTSPLPPSTTAPANTRQPGQMGTMENLLIKLITSTVSPQSWSDVGGPGTIEYYPLGMALVINQVPDVHEQVQELLDALRRLQDLEVSVEVRMITLAEAFYERIGLDFNVNLDPHVSPSLQSQIVTQQFAPLNQINKVSGGANIIGLTPGGVPTSDLNIPIQSSSFRYAIPPFGGYPNIPGADGGLSLGLAFLSDIQVFMFMEAAQGDRRTNVMQAPKLTLFNGQTSTIQIQDFQYFVTNVQVVQSGGQTAFVPQNQPIPLGVNLAVQAVVSADRRFVRLNLAPTLTNLASATVPLFPITTFITPIFEGGAQGQPIPFTQFIQQPTFTQVTVQTSVSVPDGGTVLLGGLKLLNEGRNEFGPPVLSKIPYVSRLFKNTGYGRDTSSLLLMVTPRIIINSEEEFIQTGVGGPAVPGVGAALPPGGGPS